MRIAVMDTNQCTTEQAERIKRAASFTVTYIAWLADKLDGPTREQYGPEAAQVLRWLSEGMK